jgi:hypothetical protein
MAAVAASGRTCGIAAARIGRKVQRPVGLLKAMMADAPQFGRCFSEDVPLLQQICGFCRAKRVKFKELCIDREVAAFNGWINRKQAWSREQFGSGACD